MVTHTIFGIAEETTEPELFFLRSRNYAGKRGYTVDIVNQSISKKICISSMWILYNDSQNR